MQEGPQAPAQVRPAERLFGCPDEPWRARLYVIIFESDTPAGIAFDIGLLIVIVASVLVVMLDSVQAITARYGLLFARLEWVFTLLFTVEYVLRLVCVRRPLEYARSFFGIVDLIAVLPTYIAFFLPELGALIDIRVLRLMRVFRVLKLGAYLEEFSFLAQAFADSRRKIMVFLSGVVTALLVGGTVMYVVEGPENGFTSIPTGVYWAVTTMTTVGFGDITPHTPLGRFIAGLMMLLGWGVLAVPTGIVTAEMTVRRNASGFSRKCDTCGAVGHEPRARFCNACGARL
ncbi:MAG: ion transporter [Casimicrobiaceae bacterium]